MACTASTLLFTAPRQVELRETPLSPPGPGQVQVETLCSAISPGSEMLVYRGQCPPIADEHDSLSSGLVYPAAYGYACVGRVTTLGRQVNREWKNRLVFAFQPHTSRFNAAPQALLPIPGNLSAESAAFLPNMETAVNLAQDAAPLLGERVLVLGQGVVGLLLTALLREFPLETLLTVEAWPARRAASLALGVSASLDATSPGLEAALRTWLPSGADLTCEVSGAPQALNTALHHTTFSGRIVIGSWYGEKRAELDLGGSFHRSRIRLIASQVSTLNPELSARWDKSRRFGVAWNAIARVQPEKWITHRFPLSQAAEAYRLLDQHPNDCLQILLEHPPCTD